MHNQEVLIYTNLEMYKNFSLFLSHIFIQPSSKTPKSDEVTKYQIISKSLYGPTNNFLILFVSVHVCIHINFIKNTMNFFKFQLPFCDYTEIVSMSDVFNPTFGHFHVLLFFTG